MRVPLTFVHRAFAGQDELLQDRTNEEFFEITALLSPRGGSLEVSGELYEGKAAVRHEVYVDAFPAGLNETDWYIVDADNNRREIVLVQTHPTNRRKLVVDSVRHTTRSGS